METIRLQADTETGTAKTERAETRTGKGIEIKIGDETGTEIEIDKGMTKVTGDEIETPKSPNARGVADRETGAGGTLEKGDPVDGLGLGLRGGKQQTLPHHHVYRATTRTCDSGVTFSSAV